MPNRPLIAAIGCNGAADLLEVFTHRCRVGVRHDDGGSGVTARTDGTEQTSVFAAVPTADKPDF
jgi:hypothetical protein